VPHAGAVGAVERFEQRVQLTLAALRGLLEVGAGVFRVQFLHLVLVLDHLEVGVVAGDVLVGRLGRGALLRLRNRLRLRPGLRRGAAGFGAGVLVRAALAVGVRARLLVLLLGHLVVGRRRLI